MKAFISYSQDGDGHCDWVRSFADDLIHNGVDTILDQYDLSYGGDLFAFMEGAVRDTDCILCICTPEYVARANKRTRGVGIESCLITPQLFDRHSDKQFIPVVRTRGAGVRPTPDYMASLVYADFTDDSKYRDQLEALLRHLHQKPRYRKPDLGPVPDFEEKAREIVFMPFVFFSGSMMVQMESQKIDRFRQICASLGRIIAQRRYGIVGCRPHPSRVLASVESIRGLYETAPDAPVSHASMSFPLDIRERERFAALASAAIFVGGGNGTLEEFRICQKLGISPLIPVAAVGGAGQSLAQQMRGRPRDFFSVAVPEEVLAVLARTDCTVRECADAVRAILAKHRLSPKRFYGPDGGMPNNGIDGDEE